jgi:hypothetical protein
MNCYIFASGTDTRPDRTNLTSENASREAGANYYS